MREKGKKERERKEIIKRKKENETKRFGIDNFIRKLDDHLVLYSRKSIYDEGKKY